MAKHSFHKTHIQHHKDGSHTVSHKHKEGPHKDVTHAVADLDGVHDSMQDNVAPEAPAAPEQAQAAPAQAAPAMGAPAPVGV